MPAGSAAGANPDLAAIRDTARLISRVEAADRSVLPHLGDLYKAGGSARIIGVSGPPGAGKSTLVDQLIAHYRRDGLRVAVVAVDPSSPFSGGAVLGDRVRMARHATDPGVFIRSLAARGALGGVTAATADVLTILDAAGWDVILLETVGVGQSEVEVMRIVPAVVIVQTPGGGDAVQSVKAGTLEIAHIFAVNKADMPGADRVASHLQEMLMIRGGASPHGSWPVPVVMTRANDGDGTTELAQAIAERFAWLDANPDVARSEARRRMQSRVIDLASNALRQRLTALTDAAGAMGGAIDDVLDRRCDPHGIASDLIARTAD